MIGKDGLALRMHPESPVRPKIWLGTEAERLAQAPLDNQTVWFTTDGGGAGAPTQKALTVSSENGGITVTNPVLHYHVVGGVVLAHLDFDYDLNVGTGLTYVNVKFTGLPFDPALNFQGQGILPIGGELTRISAAIQNVQTADNSLFMQWVFESGTAYNQLGLSLQQNIMYFK